MTLAIQVFRCGPLDNGVFVLHDTSLGAAVVVDPSFESEPVLAFIGGRGLRIEAIALTHGHFDHVAGLAAVHAYAPQAPIYLHQADVALAAAAPEQAAFFGLAAPPAPPPNRQFAEGEDVMLAGARWRVLHVPGHSPGSVCLYSAGSLIGGDVLFRGAIGRTDLPGGDERLLLAGIKSKVLTLPNETVVYPGHGPITTLGWEQRSNPFLH
jgi:glyoxylase-like metal-dependent hydrolase (beta-lactamase superfamily II)